ncbi:AzlC family ABC transporter permease [Legionella spiritensis]|uniref:Inner membrane protein YgaZ n=1 Tax=Legionella spiritensis TaxID=452 RepID=A0A0W0Z4N9_LEGSP|nr:AzlC family ABC transporter permease [Legionella spiritensis]KTD64108.1 Inner membrane protein YgaZ [Legionella spiritensis]SNV37859.1 Inner membrane protein YgaZ [Legionella spiritensis]
MIMKHTRSEFKQAFYATNPTFFAYFPLGLVFGVLFTNAGFPWYQAPLMSALVYAGAVQFIALGMMINHNNLAAILLAALFVALRNSFYGLSLTERFKAAPRAVRMFLIFGLVDAAYAIFVSRPSKHGENDVAFCFYTTLLLYIYWVGGTLIGAMFAGSIPEVKGLEFVLTAFFAIIVIEHFLINKFTDALFIPLAASCIAYTLLPQFYLLIAILLCAFYLYIKIKVIRS